MCPSNKCKMLNRISVETIKGTPCCSERRSRKNTVPQASKIRVTPCTLHQQQSTQVGSIEIWTWQLWSGVKTALGIGWSYTTHEVGSFVVKWLICEYIKWVLCRYKRNEQILSAKAERTGRPSIHIYTPKGPLLYISVNCTCVCVCVWWLVRTSNVRM